MSNPILEIHNISKKFRLGQKSGNYKTIRENLFSPKSKEKDLKEFWALNDVSFNVYPGDSIGIIGRNGAGKSTLLKILSRITPPTKGKVICRGRLASLLEVGTGFHGELTGRENIYLNGSILGLTKAEIKRKFDEIVAFSGVERFLDTQLKHYSSGMQLRLAFAVAAHLEPEILIIDEVLAVGDIEFQKKCVGKMEEVVNSFGRTIIFVSHNLSQISSLCKRGILLNEGELIISGGIFEVVSHYSRSMKKEININISSKAVNLPDLLFIENVLFNGGKSVNESDEIEIIINFRTEEIIEDLILGFSFTDALNNVVIECRSTANYLNFNISKKGSYQAHCIIKPNLKAGVYNLNLGARCKKGLIFFMPSIAMVEILSNNSNESDWYKSSNGLLILDSKWKIV